MRLQLRNFCGGFLGGVLGILACGYLHPWALPFGCFFGTIIGYSHDHIWASIVSAFDMAEAFYAGPRYSRTYAALVRLGSLTRNLLGLLEWDTILRRLAACMYLLGFFGASVFCFAYWDGHYTALNGCLFGASVVTFVLSCYAVLGYGLDANADSDFNIKARPGLRERSRRWNREMLDRGAWHYLGVTLVNIARVHLAVVLVVTVAGLWFLTAGVLFYAVVVLPVASFVGIIRGVYRASVRGGYWICFTVTVVVTVGVAWWLHSYWIDPTMIWLAAFAAGVASAVAVEVVRILIGSFDLERHRVARSLVVVPASRRSRWIAKGFWRLTKKLSDRFLDWGECLLPDISRDNMATGAG